MDPVEQIESGLAAQPCASLIRDLLRDRVPFAVSGAPTSDAADVVLRTSGSSGTAKNVGHRFESVEWAAATSREVLGDDGWRWLLLLSPVSTGGLMTLARSVPMPLVWPGAGGRFDAAEVADWYSGEANATAMVSTQLARLLDVPAGVRLLQDMRVILIGGGPFRQQLRRRCADLGINAIGTYGSTETLGGCVYDGLPWPGVTVTLDDGQINIAAPCVADSYIPGPVLPHPWPTGDLGRWVDGRLEVLGRVDGQVPVKGVNRFLHEYEQEALARPGVLEAVAVAVPDPVDGYRVEVFVEDADSRLPRLDSGKPDLQELLRRASGDSR